LQESIRFAQSTIDALSAHVCVLDENGAILATNMAWRRFAEANSPLAQRERTGDNYLQVCDAVIGPEAADAAAFATGIRAVTRGELANFAKEYSCDSPSEKRWFRGQVTRFPGDGPVRVVVVHENITTRRLADEERDKLMHLIEHSPDFIALAEMDGTITFVNGGGRKMLGLTAERHFSNLHLTDYVPEKWREFFRETVIATAIKDGIWRGEMQLRNLQTGSLIDVFRTVFMISDPTGQRRFFATVTQNITDRKRIERELRENTERMRIQTSALDAAANGVVITDCRGTIQWVNAAFTRLTGYPAAEVLGKNPRFLKSGHHPESFYRKIWSTILRGRVWMGEVVNRRKDGRLYHEENTITPVIDEGGAITHFIAVKQDITERKRAEEDLNFKTALLEAQVEAALDGILVVDNHGRQVVKNKRFIEVWNFPKEIAENTDDQKSLDFVTNQNKNATEFLKKVNHLNAHPREVSRDEIELIDGRFLDRYSSPVLSKEGKHYGRIWTFRDITDRKQAEASMQKMHEKLLDISREAGKSEVASSVLHNVGNVLNSVNVACCCVAKDLRNSKTANLSKVVMLMNEHEADLGTYLTNDAKGKRIRGYLAELAEHLVTEQTVALKELGELQSNIEHIKEIVARQQSYATVYGVNQTVQIKDLIDDALSMSFTSQFRRETQVSLDYELNLPRITLDKHKVLQILVNLIRNAKQACDGLAPNARRLGIRVANGTGFLRGAVVDNGVGISAENLKQVFNHGFSTKKDGHGFGLHNSAIAAKEMGGSLIAQSNGIGLGSVFTLELPLKAAPAANTPEENKPNYETLN
jgi:PAS domain S-box-containing protein